MMSANTLPRPAVSHLNLHFEEGAFSVLIGTSGRGKSTTLKMINRLIEHDSGLIRFAGEEIRSVPALELRRRGWLRHSVYRLVPHWTVAQNIATVPQLEKWTRQKIAERVDELMALLGLEPALRDRYPHQLLSRAATACGRGASTAANPQVLLMDEPFGARPGDTECVTGRDDAHSLILGRTIILVTHDIDEALRLGDRLILMDNGEVIQQGAPLDVFNPTATDFVRDFFGRSELGARLLSLRTVGDYLRPPGMHIDGEPLQVQMSLRDALSAFVARHVMFCPLWT
jgi:osmoprotectant transport system ATP-binding protein